ncbi:hypothetical protein EA473_01325 [Natrarchaeobius chitinivorans]|uniref:Uncharacterized protein n=1 Tax=Natrarchaeobius chitinivorans TaxID=1679083 RepID=A0A3N6MNZ7_NATCH|nr:hypothetical protein EA473_01325 [Natrarchaeobius chitinivorans]
MKIGRFPAAVSEGDGREFAIDFSLTSVRQYHSRLRFRRSALDTAHTACPSIVARSTHSQCALECINRSCGPLEGGSSCGSARGRNRRSTPRPIRRCSRPAARQLRFRSRRFHRRNPRRALPSTCRG